MIFLQVLFSLVTPSHLFVFSLVDDWFVYTEKHFFYSPDCESLEERTRRICKQTKDSTKLVTPSVLYIYLWCKSYPVKSSQCTGANVIIIWEKIHNFPIILCTSRFTIISLRMETSCSAQTLANSLETKQCGYENSEDLEIIIIVRDHMMVRISKSHQLPAMQTN